MGEKMIIKKFYVNNKMTSLKKIKDYIYDIARTRGLQVGNKYAEAYEAIRIVI